jgi:[ribosomal protein S18]-alanine N-acetyltransferase
MVARPPVKLLIEAMRLEDLGEVHRIEQASFTTPWPENAYRSELMTNRLASYLVARLDGEIVAYGGMWLMVDEAHITTFAVHPAYRRQRVGERLLLAFLDLARDRHAREATLEVRLSNLPARRLYEKYGFRPVGVRPRYYSDNNEDALIMTTEPLSDRRLRSRIERLRAALDDGPPPAGPFDPGDDASGDGAPRDGRASRPSDAGGDAVAGPGAPDEGGR